MSSVRKINVREIKDTVAKLAVEANLSLRKDVLNALKSAWKKESSHPAKRVLKVLIENASIAHKEKIPICQDTGMAMVFIEIGQNVLICGGNLEKAVTEGIAEGYKKGFLRKSVVLDPLTRINTGDNTPAVIHSRIVSGNKVKITVAPKGFGSENKSMTRMFRPSDSVDSIENFIVDAVKTAGPDACPPFVLGVGIGGSLEKACLIAKDALLRPLDKRSPKAHIAAMERRLLDRINKLNIGPMGLGGKTTVLGLNIETYATHIAGLPVCVNISCHATRSAAKTL